jgi:ATP-dependent RNA helicase RhlB
MLRKIIRRVKDKVEGKKTKQQETAAATVKVVEPAAPVKDVWQPGRSEKEPAGERPPRRRRPPRVAADNTEAPPREAKEQRPRPSQPAKNHADGADRPRRRRRRGPRPAGTAPADQAPHTEAAPRPRPDRPQLQPLTPHAGITELVQTPKTIAPFEGQTAYADYDIPEPIKRALDEMHFKVTTPIQARLLPIALAGKDAAGKAQTGTGKTAAFLITMFSHFLRKPIEGERPHGHPRALILAPTRELALQIKKDAQDIGRYCNLHTVAVYGGMDFDKQQRELEQPVDVIVATPGRLMDFASRKVLNLRQVEVLVIDEADRMLDMGFIPDVRKIVRMTPPPERRQTLLFSATLTPDIMRLAAQWTHDAETVEIEPERVAAESVNQRVIITTQDEKFRLLYNLLVQEQPERVLIFSNRRDQAEMLHDHLKSYGFETALLSGAVDQKKRVRVLDDFKAGKVRVLVATDVAGRGLHVNGISHVINYHMPMDPDDYVHRIGRTGRAGSIGTSISFACELDSFAIPDIETFIGHPLVCEHPEDHLLAPLPEPNYRVEKKPRAPRSNNGPRSNSGRPRSRRPR